MVLTENEKKGTGTNILQDWLKTQEKLLETWKESVKSFQPESARSSFGEPFDQMLKEWQNNQQRVLDLWKVTMSGSGSGDPTQQVRDFYGNWVENYHKMFDDLTKMFPSQVGKETFEKMFKGGKVYSELFDFWNKYLSSFINKPDALFSGTFPQMPKEWLEDYNKVLNEFFKQGFGGPFNDYIKSTSELADAYRQSLESFLSPWMENSDKLRENAMNAMKGDNEAYMEFLKTWNQAFHESHGRLFNIPGFGLGKEQSEKMLQSVEAYMDYSSALNEFTASLQKVGYDVMETLMNRIMELKEEGNPPETFKEFYDLWIEENEKAYMELFKEDSFAKMLGKVVDASAKFKKRYDVVMMEVFKDLPIPTDQEMDTLYKNFYELKVEVREQKKELEKIKKNIDEKQQK